MENTIPRTVDGLTLEIRQCGHCKAIPSDDEIRAAMKWRHQIQPVCAICAKALSYIHKYVTHQPEDGDAFAWKSYGDWEPAMKISSSESTDPKLHYLKIWVHVACFRNAVPNLDKFNKTHGD